MAEFLGIDIGGTNVKFGVVDTNGKILKKKKYPTKEVAENDHFIENLAKLIKKRLKKFPNIERVGIGIPGTLSNDRRSTLDLPNLPELGHKNVIDSLRVLIPSIDFKMENDANAAALGEFYFGEGEIPPTYIFITLGTGVGGGAVINKSVFKGGDGNGMEIGHIFAGNGHTVEQNIGKVGIIAMAKSRLLEWPEESPLAHLDEADFDAKAIARAAHMGDSLALDVYKEMGYVLGQAIVSIVRILDIKTILIGGGVSETYPYLKDEMNKVIHQFLPKYYTDSMDIKLATLGNNAGIIGAASLCFD